jgi:hypothetical protein
MRFEGEGLQRPGAAIILVDPTKMETLRRRGGLSETIFCSASVRAAEEQALEIC